MRFYFVSETAFILENPTDRNTIIIQMYLIDIVSKINEVKLSSQGKQLTNVGQNDKFQAFRIRILENICLPPRT